MAIVPTGEIYKALEFDGVSSRDYGVYITGSAVFNAPERDVEMITIPGRNGAFALDNGRFENITVTYPAGIFAENEEDFAEAISEFRNYLCSKRGYCRLQDEYNPDEYRLAIYKSGLEVEPAFLKAGEFEIVFDCKPQRWLTEGEEAVTVASGDLLVNPTLFESSPLLEVEGYGDIDIGGQKITVNQAVLGEVETSGKSSSIVPTLITAQLPAAYLKEIDYSKYAGAVENGDSLFIESIGITAYSVFPDPLTGATPSPTITSNIGTATASGAVNNSGYVTFTITALINNIELTAFTNESYTATITAPLKNTSNQTLRTLSIDVSIINHASGLLEINASYSGSAGTKTAEPFYGQGSASSIGGNINYGRTYIYSTQSILGNPLYLDCDFGEAYKIEGGVVIGLNQHIDLGSKLPTLGDVTEINYDDTITDLKVIPRWWKV